MSDPAPPLARLTPTPFRRAVSTALIFALSGAFFYLAISGQIAAAAGQILLIVLAAATLLLALRSYQTRRLGLLLTPDGLSDSDGQLLVALDQIRSVDRGAFAFKPSNGFVLRLLTPASTAWVPGLYWRVGVRMGIGGAVQPAEARAMADGIGFLLADRALARR